MSERLKSRLGQAPTPTPMIKTVDDQREIPRCMAAIYNIVEQLEETVQRLNQKTSCIQQNTPPSVKVEDKQTEACSELGNQLAIIGQRILDIQNNLIELINRIEL